MEAVELSPRVGTSVTGKGKVITHTVSKHGLHTTVIELADAYPDLSTWMGMLPDGARLMRYDYAEKFGIVFTGYLWMYWKEKA